MCGILTLVLTFLASVGVGLYFFAAAFADCPTCTAGGMLGSLAPLIYLIWVLCGISLFFTIVVGGITLVGKIFSPPQSPEKNQLQTVPYPQRNPSNGSLSKVVTPLLSAIISQNTDSVRAALAEHPQDLNTAYAQNGNTPLHVAALNGQAEIVKLLLAQPGLDKTRQNNDGKTALDLAQEKNLTEIAELLKGE